MLQNGPELWKWIQEGVSIYVCGEASRMAKNVHGALCTIAEKEGSMSADSAQDYVSSLPPRCLLASRFQGLSVGRTAGSDLTVPEVSLTIK